jgi:hypothetical protein
MTILNNQAIISVNSLDDGDIVMYVDIEVLS